MAPLWRVAFTVGMALKRSCAVGELWHLGIMPAGLDGFRKT